MTRRVPLAPETRGEPEAFHRAGAGLPEHYASAARVTAESERLRRCGLVIDVHWLRAATRCRFRQRTIRTGTVRVTLQFPPTLGEHMDTPRIRTEHGEGAVYSPSNVVWERARGPDRRWSALLERLPDQPWDRTRRWIQVDLRVSDPGQWLAELVRMIDAKTARREVQTDLFA